MDERIQVGDKLELKKIQKRLYVDTEDKIYVSQVLDESENDKILVSMPIQSGHVIPLGIDQEFIATFYTKTGLLSSKVVVTGRYKKGSLFLLEIKLLNDLEKIQRREFYRLDCRIDLQYRLVDAVEQQYIEEGKAYNPDELEIEWKRGVMLDLSGGGIRFVSPSKEEKGALMEIRFDMELDGISEVVYTLANVLFSIQNENNNQIYEQRVQFYRMDQALQERIIHYIFQTQRRNRTKELGLE
ncbi:MAG: flagellar brake domain-containing protein [Lachnospiraceae bacterium]|nr:flagellar brake domain-containing protein [Lachnospiraceae bacterium]